MNIDKTLEVAKKIITEEIEKTRFKVLKILLFGSRTKDTYKKDSDWDFYVIVNDDIDFGERWEIILRIKRRLAQFEIPNDIIINSVKWVNKYHNDVGRITYYALKKGIEI